MKLLVTGGCGFIGSNFIRYWKETHPEDAIVVADVLTYAGNPANIEGIEGVKLFRGDVASTILLEWVFSKTSPEVVVHLAAESHVDRSIYGAGSFLQTNVLGTEALLEAARAHGVKRFVHVSTDEVMGDRDGLPPAKEEDMFRPSSPYAASKAAGDHLAFAHHRTHGLPVVVVRPSNAYGPRQHPEKLIPTVIMKVLAGEKIPVYGDGQQIREWLHVRDLCRALDILIERGTIGQAYHVGGGESARWSNLGLIELISKAVGCPAFLETVKDRPGHDRRYALDSSKMKELGWKPECELGKGIMETASWYKENEAWWRATLQSKEHQGWVERNYVNRGH